MTTPTTAQPLAAFCKKYQICRATFYNLEKSNRAPKTIMVGGKRYVTDRAEQAWLEALENQAA